MATLVFWHVPLRFCNGEALTNARPKQAQRERTLRDLTCMAKLSVDLELLQAARSFVSRYHVPLAIPLILHVPNAG